MEGYKVNWNFIQSSTCMCIERAFRILKDKWEIIMRRVDIPLRHMTNVIATCIVLHNMFTIRNDIFDIEWIEEVDRELNRHINNRLLRGWQEIKAKLVAIGEVKNIRLTNNSVGIT